MRPDGEKGGFIRSKTAEAQHVSSLLSARAFWKGGGGKRRRQMGEAWGGGNEGRAEAIFSTLARMIS